MYHISLHLSYSFCVTAKKTFIEEFLILWAGKLWFLSFILLTR